MTIEKVRSNYSATLLGASGALPAVRVGALIGFPEDEHVVLLQKIFDIADLLESVSRNLLFYRILSGPHVIQHTHSVLLWPGMRIKSMTTKRPSGWLPCGSSASFAQGIRSDDRCRR